MKIIKHFSTQKVVLGFALVLLFTLCAYPFTQLIKSILFSGESGQLDFQAFLDLGKSRSLGVAIKNTLLVSLSVTVLCTLFAVPLAWLLARTHFPLARKFRSLLCLPYAIPPYIGAIAWIFLANPTTGLINQAVGFDLINIYSFWGLVWVETSFLYTFILLTALASLDRMDSSFEEAARLSGASPAQVFFQITLPLIRPAIVSGGVLVFLATAASFGVPALIGSPARIYMLTTQIYTFQKMGSLSGMYRAGALSILLLLFALVILLINQHLLKKNQFQTVSGKTSRPSLIDLGFWRWPLFSLTCGFVLLVFILPMSGILISALSQVQGQLQFSNFSLDNFQRVFFQVKETPRAISNSFILAGSVASLAAIFGLALSYMQFKTKLPFRNWIEILASLPYSAPGTVVAFAMILTFSQGLFGVLPSLYNTLWLLGIAYFVKYLSFSIKTTGDGYRQIDDVLAEAARVSGASWMQTMMSIWLPLMKPSLIAAWFLIFMPVLSELTMTIFLTGPGLETIGTLIFQMQEYSDASGGGASVLAVSVVFAVIGINYLVKKMSKGQYGL
jgi:iron(III) transport system permease protein